MNTPYVTIGGKEIVLTPGDARLHSPPASAGPAAARAGAGHMRQIAAMIGFLALLSLLIGLAAWRSQQHHRR